MVTYTLIVSAFSVMLVGLFGMIVHRNIIRILLAVNLLETGVNLLIVALGYVPGGAAPIITKAISAANLPFVDPLPQALVLTSIVIGLGTTALALTITLRYYRERRTLDLGSESREAESLAGARAAGEPGGIGGYDGDGARVTAAAAGGDDPWRHAAVGGRTTARANGSRARAGAAEGERS